MILVEAAKSEWSTGTDGGHTRAPSTIQTLTHRGVRYLQLVNTIVEQKLEWEIHELLWARVMANMTKARAHLATICARDNHPLHKRVDVWKALY